MNMVKVKSYSRGDEKVKSHTRGSSGGNSKYVGDCSKEGVKNKYNNVSKIMDMPKNKISTGSDTADKVVTKIIKRAVPLVGYSIQAINDGPKYGTYVARAKKTYDETCRKKK